MDELSALMRLQRINDRSGSFGASCIAPAMLYSAGNPSFDTEASLAKEHQVQVQVATGHALCSEACRHRRAARGAIGEA